MWHPALGRMHSGRYDRQMHAKDGKVKLEMPKLRNQTFETAIIEHYRRRDSSIERILGVAEGNK